MHMDGLIIGIFSFLVIGLFHPIVIKGEYYFSKRIWPLFLIAGAVLLVWSVFLDSYLLSAIVSVTAFSCFWSIKELFEQEERVKKGWFPANPARRLERKEEDT